MDFLEGFIMRYNFISKFHDEFHGFTEFQLSQKIVLDC